MDTNLDGQLDQVFTPERVIREFYDYRHAKWNRLSGFDAATVNVPMGADGISDISFENQIARHAVNICRRIRDDSYIFYPFREIDVPKDRRKALSENNMRTLGIASIRDALVQSILYRDILLRPCEQEFKEIDKTSRVSFGYRKGVSISDAAVRVRDCAREGYRFVWDADLTRFFDSIPHDVLLSRTTAFFGNNVRVVRLVRRFICVDRVPHATYMRFGRKGRPSSRIFCRQKPNRVRRLEGVPQGGVLSGLLANVYLHEFDLYVTTHLMRLLDIRYVRYADDFVIMSRDEHTLHCAEEEIRATLASSQFQLTLNDSKTKTLDLSVQSLTFVGYTLQNGRLSIKKASVENFKDRLTSDVFQVVPSRLVREHSSNKTLSWLVTRLNSKICGMRGRDLCPKCRLPRSSRARSWVSVYRALDDLSQLEQLDRWIRKSVYDYMHSAFRIRLSRSKLRPRMGARGLRSLVSEFHATKRSGGKLQMPCLCDLESAGHRVDEYACILFEGRQFYTLANKAPFTVPRVSPTGVQISVRGNQSWIALSDIQELWNRLVRGDRVTRTGIEAEGFRNSSQLVSLVARLPGVVADKYPISLTLERHPPAPFMAGMRNERSTDD